MKKFFVIAAALMTSLPLAVSADHIWINEFHYDNNGTDLNETVEIAFRSGSTTSIGDYNVDLYNGSNGTLYGTLDLALATMGTTVSILNDPRTVTFYTIPGPGTGIQNGGPDGLALSLKTTSALVGGFLSYEGVFAATSGPANGVTSTDVGVAETGTTSAAGSLSLVGNGLAASGFTWAVTDPTSTFGDTNTGQTFSGAVVPEPGSAAMLALFAGVGMLRRRR